MELLTLVLMILAVEQISHYLTEGMIFEDLRVLILNKSEFFGQLVHCFECTSFWVSGLVVFLVQPFERWGLNVIAVFAILVPAQLLNVGRHRFREPTQKQLPPPED